MAKKKEPVNPFYVVLLLVGVVFFITASAYGVMTLRADRVGRMLQSPQRDGGLMGLLEEHGGKVLGVELLVLGLCTGLAIGSDRFWTRRLQRFELNGLEVEQENEAPR